MTDYTELGTVKQGADFSATIAVTINGNAQNLAASGWSVEAQARLTAADTDAVDFTINAADKVNSEVTLELAPADTEAMVPGPYLVDVKITAADGTVYVSDTYEIVVEAAITRDAPA